MTPQFASDLSRHALITAMLVASPILVTGLVVGLAVALFQAMTQVQEMSLTFVPKIVAMAIAAYLSADWMMQHLVQFTKQAFSYAAGMGA